jgi:hypothetical protein
VTEEYDRRPRVFARVIVPPAPFMVVLDPKKSYNLARDQLRIPKLTPTYIHAGPLWDRKDVQHCGISMFRGFNLGPRERHKVDTMDPIH